MEIMRENQPPLNRWGKNVLLRVIFLCYTIFLVAFFYQAIIQGKFSGLLVNKSYPMLLDSGITDAQEAELRIVIWFEQGQPQKDFTKDLPQAGWVWRESSSYGMATAYSIAGYTTIEADREREIFAWYRDFERKVRAYGGIAYLDERVPEAMDLAHYAIGQEIQPRQFSLTDGTISIAGWYGDILPQVQAGEEIVNIQLISQSYDGKGRTALAIPVLLEEF